MKRILLPVMLLIVILITLPGCSSQNGDKVIAEVNGKAVTQADWDRHYKFFKSFVELQQGKSFDQNSEDDRKILDEMESWAYDEVVMQEIIWQDASKQGIKVSDEEINQELENLQQALTAYEVDYQQYLHDTGLQDEDIKEELTLQVAYSKLVQKITGSLTVTEEEITNYYDENQDKFSGTRIFHILLETEDEANEIIAKLNHGEDFSELARKFSLCPSKEQGGDLGLVNEQSNLVSEFKEAALKLKENEITLKPVKTQYGYHIIKAGEYEKKTLDEVREQIKNTLASEKQQSEVNTYVEKLYNDADIKDLRE